VTTEQPAQRRKRKVKWLPLGMGEGAAPQRGGLRRGLRHFLRGASSNIRSPVLGYRFGRKLRESGPPAPGASAPRESNPLEDYFDRYEEGPGIWKWRHYFDVYHRHLSKFVGREVHLVEIGVFGGGSLEMWKSYFGGRLRLYGVDIDPASQAIEGEGIEMHIGDQGDPRFWESFRESVPVVDVVIDDGGHQTGQQIATLEGLLPHMRAGGVYVCEDIFQALKGFHSYVDALARHLHSLSNEQFLQHVASVHHYPFITVIEKPEVPPPPLESQRRGTEWPEWSSFPSQPS
jgi:hypothetical protein